MSKMLSDKNEKTNDFRHPDDADLISSPTMLEHSLSMTSQALSNVPSEVIIKTRIKYGSNWSACQGLMAEYSKSTSVHGMRYIFEIHRPLYEKFYWVILMFISFNIAVSLMWNTYRKWQESPVILGFDETLVPANQIPFPTITICPEIKIDALAFNFTNVSEKIWSEIEEYQSFQNMANLTDEEVSYFVATLHICESEVLERFSKYMPKDINVNVAQNLVDLSMEANTTLPGCRWHGRMYFCYMLFKYVVTDEGICYQFNGLQAEDIYRDPQYLSYYDETKINYNNFLNTYLPQFEDPKGNWSLDDGYVNQGFNAYPQRSVLPSARNGLYAFMMGFEHNFEYTCRSFKQGYKVFLNSPESVPLTSGNYILVAHEDEVLVSVQPEYITSMDNLHDVGPDKRQCYFNDERHLRYFKAYSQNNCQTECLANFTMAKCGCVKFWMPKPLDVPVCGLSDSLCYANAADEMNFIISNQTKFKSTNPNVQIMCDCMPSCNSLDYNFEISRSYFDFENTVLAFRNQYEHTDGRGSRLTVYFKDRQFTAIKRRVMYGITTLIANFGGIFALFMGISILSIIELIYFFSIRLFKNLYKRSRIKQLLLQPEIHD